MDEVGGRYQMLMNRKKGLIFFFLISLLVSCQSNSAKSNLEENNTKIISEKLSNEDTVSVINHNSIITTSEKLIDFVPDTTINKKLFLENSSSLVGIYSGSKPLKLIERLRESPINIFVNKSNKEYLLAYQYEGNTNYTYSCIEIGYLEDDKVIKSNDLTQTEETYFKTESGLSLGLSLEEVVNIKGKEYEQQEFNDFIVLSYRIDDYESSAFLKRYRMPGYFIQIKLKNNIVTKITFGFDYP
ncbi:hypothetical protein [Flavobacterium sp. JP2137]|uniref:hypothetical protein n=1 Tax=Flavobacterium sp. JP2137 TaxID=3414510 RepID=UPI003D2FE465